MSRKNLRATGGILLATIIPVVMATSSIKIDQNLSDFIIVLCVGFGLTSLAASILSAPWREWIIPMALLAFFLLGTAGCGFWLYRIEEGRRAKLVEPHVVVGTKTYHWDYPSGTNLDGIKWKQGYAFSRVIFSNRTDHDFSNLDIRIKPEHPIIEGVVLNGFNECKFGPFIPPTQSSDLTLLGKPVGSDTWQVAGVIAGEAEHIDDTYRLFCQRFAPRSEAEILIATVVDRDTPFSGSGLPSPLNGERRTSSISPLIFTASLAS